MIDGNEIYSRHIESSRIFRKNLINEDGGSMVVEFDSTVAPPAWIISSFEREGRIGGEGRSGVGTKIRRTISKRRRGRGGWKNGKRQFARFVSRSMLAGSRGRRVPCNLWPPSFSTLSPPPPSSRRFVTDGYERKFEKL